MEPTADASANMSDGEFLRDDIEAVSVSPNGRFLFYVLPEEDLSASGQTIDLSTKQPKYSFQFPFSDWLPEVLNDGTLRLTTKPSGFVPGTAYQYNEATKRLKKLFGASAGFTTKFSPSGKRALYSFFNMSNYALGLGVRVLPEEDTEAPIPGFGTLPEKCAWSSGESKIYCGVSEKIQQLIPDNWYRGLFFFDDSIWSFDLATGDSERVVVPKDAAKVSLDIVDPFVTEDGKTLIFKDKREGYLWALTLPGTVVDIPEIDETLTPEEAKDAAGSVQPPATTSAATSNKKR
jgi:hypothetical protein